MASWGTGEITVVRNRYPHMMKEDSVVWSRFLEGRAAWLQEVWYDVHVGVPVEAPGYLGEMGRRVAAGLTMKRIDVVARTRLGLWVVEVKPYCSMLAVGQVLTYARAFVVQYGYGDGVWPVVVCDEWDDDVEGLCEALGVMVISNMGRKLHNDPTAILLID